MKRKREEVEASSRRSSAPRCGSIRAAYACAAYEVCQCVHSGIFGTGNLFAEVL